MSTRDKLPTHPIHLNFKHFPMFMTFFVVILLCSNLIGPGKTSRLPIPFTDIHLTFGVGNIFFPFSYIFGDILTEVYGYAQARKVIWAGFIALVFSSIMSAVVIWLPIDPHEPFNHQLQPALELVFGFLWRISIASMIAYWTGDFANSYVLAKMKVWTRGRWLWTRTIGSTIVGQGVDSLIFYPIAFYGVWTFNTILLVCLFNWFFKVLIEVVMTPVTYIVVFWLKKVEQVDVYDVNTNFTPFSLKDS